MNINLDITSKKLINQSTAVRQERRQLLRAFWLAVSVLFLLEFYTVQTRSTTSIVGASLIALAALFPIYLWCSGKALGMPIFPIFALTYLWTYAIPLVSNSLTILTYSPDEIFFASITVAGSLGLGTLIWFQFVKFHPTPPKYYRVLGVQNTDGLLLVILIFAIVFNMFSLGGWFDIKGGTVSLIRGTILGLTGLAVFVLSYRCGTRQLLETKTYIFLSLLALYIITR